MPTLEVSSETTTQQAAGNGVGYRCHNFVPRREYSASDGIQPEEGLQLVVRYDDAKRVLNARESDSLLDLILEGPKTSKASWAPEIARLSMDLQSVP